MSKKKRQDEQELTQPNDKDSNVKFDIKLIWNEEKQEVKNGDNIPQRQSNKNRI